MVGESFNDLYRQHVREARRLEGRGDLLGALEEHSMAGKFAGKKGRLKDAYFHHGRTIEYAERILGQDLDRPTCERVTLQLAFAHVNAGKNAIRHSLRIKETPTDSDDGKWWQSSVNHFCEAKAYIRRLTKANVDVGILREKFTEHLDEVGDKAVMEILKLEPPAEMMRSHRGRQGMSRH